MLRPRKIKVITPKKIFDQQKSIFLAKILTESGFSNLSFANIKGIFEHYVKFLIET